MRRPTQNRRGQIIVMVTFVLFAMVGVLGLAVDLGWSYFTKKSAQAAADSAALGAVRAAYAAVGSGEGTGTPVYQCGVNVTCQAVTQCPNPVPNPPTNDIENGCLYAQRNGFRVSGDGGRQNVTFQADVTPTPPTAPGIHVYYWATARVTQSIPQLFSSILGNTVGSTSARATAAIADSTILGSLILINREGDCVRMGTGNQSICGVDLLVQANDNNGLYALSAEGGILMASTRHGESNGRYSGENQGSGTVHAPFTSIRGAGDVSLGGGSQWIQDPDNGYADRSYFKDPMRGKGQPPPPPASLSLPDKPIVGGMISGTNDPNNPLLLLPGNYYAASYDNKGNLAVTGDQIQVDGYVRFSSGGTGFGNYVVFGGLANKKAGTVVTFDPGRYVFAGARQQQGAPTSLFDVQKNMTVQDLTPGTGRNSDAGEIFIFADANYPGLVVPQAVEPVRSQLVHGISGFQTGNSSDISINIHGLNRDNAALPEALKPFTPVIIWQDQGNSIIKYTPDGYIDTSCPGGNASVGCPNTALVDDRSVELSFKASPGLHIYGTAYQPRGAFTSMNGGGGYDSPLQLIAGALTVHANSNVKLRGIDNPTLVKVVTLVE